MRKNRVLEDSYSSDEDNQINSQSTGLAGLNQINFDEDMDPAQLFGKNMNDFKNPAMLKNLGNMGGKKHFNCTSDYRWLKPSTKVRIQCPA